MFACATTLDRIPCTCVAIACWFDVELVPLAPSVPRETAWVRDVTTELKAESAVCTVDSTLLTFCVYWSTSAVSMVFCTISAAAAGLSEGTLTLLPVDTCCSAVLRDDSLCWIAASISGTMLGSTRISVSNLHRCPCRGSLY